MVSCRLENEHLLGGPEGLLLPLNNRKHIASVRDSSLGELGLQLVLLSGFISGRAGVSEVMFIFTPFFTLKPYVDFSLNKTRDLRS